jgi:2-keto-3-deoxy-L-rhamnonate aldolase RhmA
MQVETRACFDALDEVLAVPGITCAFLGEHGIKHTSALFPHTIPR